MSIRKLLVFSGTAHPELTKRICKYLNSEMGDVTITCFPDLEIDVKVNSDVRGADVFVVQPTCTPANERLMELLILVDCLKRASAGRVTAVIPYYGYARKDRKDEGRVPITAKLVANLLTTTGCDRILTIDLHTAQIQGFFDIPVDHLLARAVFIPYFQKLKLKNLAIVSPDVGSVRQARAYAKRLSASLAIVDKRRETADEVVSLQLVGEVAGKNVLVVDDMISTGSTMVEACKLARENDALDIYCCATHPVLCGEALARLSECKLKKIVVGDTIPIPSDKMLPNFKVLSMAPYIGEAIRRTHNSQSISYLFDNPLEEFLTN